MVRRLVAPLCAFLCLLAPAARAQCNFLTLATGVPQSSAVDPAQARFSPAVGSFMAVGARSGANTNHSYKVGSGSAGFPTCVSGVLANSATPSGVEVVVGDYRPGHNTAGARYTQAVRSAGSGDVTFEWEGTARALTAGEPADSTYQAPNVLDVYQAFLEGGNPYTLNFTRTGADLKVLVFANPGAGTYWEGRGGASMLLTLTEPTLFVPPSSDDYAMVVVNDDGGVGTYELWVEQCQAPDTLHTGVAASAAYPYRLLFDAVDPYWQAIGVRGDPAANWNLAVYDTGRGSPEPICFAGQVAASTRPSGVDFVVGDLSSGPLTSFYARDWLAGGSGAAVVEWDGGPDEIQVGGPTPILRSTDANDVLEIWDVFFDAAQTYTIDFAPTGSAALRWFLFANPNQGPGGTAWFGRDQAVLSSTLDGVYTATSEGWHGLVVVNENGGVGGYTLSVTSNAAVDVGPPGAPRTALGTIAPNPMRGTSSIGYTLAKGARVRIEVVDVAGRRVARLDGGSRPAGAGSLPWDGQGEDGGRLDSGVYFARLFVDDAMVGAARMVLLR
jgi:hypothetical protein